MNDYNVIGIVWWKEKDGTIKYGCRGTGPKYRNFYANWVPNSSYRCTSTDWPWDYFVLDNPDDHDRILKDYADDIYEDNYE